MNKRIVVSLLILFLSSVVHAGNVIILNPGCRQFNSAGQCTQCSTRFYKNSEGICQPVNNNCKTYKAQNGACTSCYDGFSIIQDSCLPKAQVDEMIGLADMLANCNEIGDNGVCKKCSIGFYFDAKGACKQIPDTCANFNINTAKCLGCYPGYQLNQKNGCSINTQIISDPGCFKFQGSQCVQCSVGYYFDSNKQCKAVPAICQNFDTTNFRCKQCYSGYSLDKSFNCVESSQDNQIDLGCSKFQNGACVKCSQGFYFNKIRICTMIPTSCSSFDTFNQVCQGCYPGYTLDSNKVCVQSTTGSIDLGCSKFDNGKCVRCSFGFYFNKARVCTLIPPSCGNFDTTKQICNACYPGYVLDLTNNCVVSTSTNSDPGCNSFENGKCIKCSYGYYFDKFENCKQIPVTCSNYDISRQLCLKCYPGYDVDPISNKCVESIASSIDPGCSTFERGVCTRCSNGYYFDSSRKCAAIPPTCSNFDKVKGECKGCYPGYALDSNKVCVVSIDTGITDFGCSKFQNGKCMACSVGFFFNTAGNCQQIPSSCSNFDTIMGVCKGCYLGYELNFRNQCVPSANSVNDPNCKQFKNNKCVACSTGSFFDNQGKCILSDNLCKRFNSNTKRCEQCYPGFSLDTLKFTCIEASFASIDPNCKTFKDNQCAQCSFRFFKDFDGLCKSVDPTCKFYNVRNGQCTGCYDGYKLSNTKCVQDTTGEVSDPNCAEWKNGLCTKCSYGSYFGPKGICKLVDPLCMTWNELNGQCKSCYPSFELNLGSCVASTKNYDPNCNKFSSNGECVQCSRGFYFNLNSKCTQIDPLCSSFDSKAARCLGCYSGYKVSSGKCVQDTETISDQGCAEFKNSRCAKCSVGFYFDQNNRCKAINPQCSFFDFNTKKCGQCYPGYILSNDNCVVSNKDNLCAQWKDGICVKCGGRAYFNDQGGCSEVSSYCNDFDVFDGSCLSCYGGFSLKDGNCSRSAGSDGCVSFGKDSTCLQCEKRRYLDNGVCLKIDQYCQQFNFFKKTCTQCYRGYAVVNGKCIISQIKADMQIENCFTYSLQGDCVECFDRFYLKNNTCKQVNILCKKYDQNTGDCTDCYTGFKLTQGKCNRK